MNKLLNKPLKAFTLYALLILTGSIPAYYFIVDSIWLEELDEHNYIIREQTQNGFNALQNKEELEKAIALWNQVQPTTTIFPVPKNDNAADSIYTTTRTMTHNGKVETDRFRGLFTYIQIGGGLYGMSIETNVEEADETVLSISLITCVFIAILIIGFILLNKRLSKRIWEPFYDTLNKLKQFDLNISTPIHFKTSNIEEFMELSISLSRLIENNIKVYARQKEFTQNASHELQTPLALLKSKIDLLIQDDSLTREQRQTIEALDEYVSRIGRINKNLLLLAGIENKTYKTETVNLSKQVTLLLNTFKEFLSEENSVTENIQPNVLQASNEGLVEVLVGNLLSNAFRHGTLDNSINVTLTETKLVVSNTGLQPLILETLFLRFRPASTQNPGTGLGLAIVKEICDKYGWEVSYQFVNNKHTFSVKF